MNSNLVVHFSGETAEWETPQYLFDQLNQEFKFEVDVCALPQNAKCPKYYTPSDDGLARRWEGICWMNPPYGREIWKWVAKAYYSSRAGICTVVCLLPARTDTRWWHEWCMKGEVRFIKGRLKFSQSKNNAPFPSAVVIFRPDQ